MKQHSGKNKHPFHYWNKAEKISRNLTSNINRFFDFSKCLSFCDLKGKVIITMLNDLLNERRSIRAFLPKPVQQEKLDAILEAAGKTASWTNVQPWEVFVVTGRTLERIKNKFQEKHAQKAKSELEVPWPTKWSETAKARQGSFFADIEKDEAVSSQFFKLNDLMFHAPAVIYICVDKTMSEWTLYDIGLYSQSIMLLATEHGLGTMPAVTLAQYPEVLRKELNIPENLKLTIGIAIGYIDGENPINSFRSSRVSIDETVRFFS